MPDHTQRIVNALAQTPWPRTTAALAQATGLRPQIVTKALDRLSAAGVVQRVARGTYKLPGGEG